MSHSIFTRLLRGLSAGALALSLLAAPLAISNTAEAQPGVHLTVRRAPPSYRPDYQRPHRPDGRYTWTEGYWTWNGAQYVWQPGQWVLARRDHRYEEGRWMRHGDGYSFRGPRWVRSHGYGHGGGPVFVQRPMPRPTVVLPRPAPRPMVVVNRPGRHHFGFDRRR